MRLKALRQKRADLVNEAKGIFAAAARENRDLTADEQARDDQIQAELDTVDQEIAREQRQQDRERAVAQNAARQSSQAATDDSTDFRSLGDFLQAVAFAGMPGRNADPRLFGAASGLNSSVPAEGGFLVRRDFSDQLLQRAVEAAVLLPACTEIPVGEGADGIDMPTIDETSRADGSRWGGVQMYWAAEAGSVTATKPKIARNELRLEELKGLCYATERNLRDAVALEAIITKAFASEFAFKIDDAIFRGDGAGKPLGILSAPALVTVAKEGGQIADTVVYENLLKMFAAMDPRSLPKAAWYYNHGDVFPQLATMSMAVGTGGVPVFMPASGAAGAPFGTLFGRPLRPIEQASAKGDVGDIVFADLSEYLVIRKGGLQAASSVHVRFIYDEMTFKFTVSINGQPAWKSAKTPFKGAQTVSPYVALAAR